MAEWTSLSLDNPPVSWAAWASFPTSVFVILLTSRVLDIFLGMQPLISESR